MRRRQPTLAAGLAALAVAATAPGLAGCSGDEGGGQADAGADTDYQPADTGQAARWQVETVVGGDVGREIDLVVGPDGTVRMAWFAMAGTNEGLCDALGADTTSDEVRWPLTYAYGEPGAWQTETAAEPLYVGTPPGLDLAVTPGGQAALALMIGEPVADIGYCGANDVGYLVRQAGGDWQAETVVQSGDEALADHEPSDYGEVVGYWPALAFDAQGQPAIAYKDVHAGGMQSDDFRRADLEFATRSGGGWSAVPVDFGRGAGNGNQLLYDSAGRPTIGYYIPTEGRDQAQIGVWVSRWDEAAQVWQQVQLSNQPSPGGLAMALDADDGLRVAMYNANLGYPQLATLTADGQFASVADGWQVDTDIGDSRYDEGYRPSMAVGPGGTLAVAYYRCANAEDQGDCQSDVDAVVVAWEDGGDWYREVVDAGQDGFCGTHPAVGFDADGHPVVAYPCETLVGGQLGAEVRFARRTQRF